MKSSWLHQNRKSKLIVFCNGWGMDGAPLRSFSSHDFDVFMLYDYRSMSDQPDIEKIVLPYEEVILIGWSIGVWAGQKLFSGDTHLFDRTIACNGTLCPVHDRFGIPHEVFQETLSDYDESGRIKFYRRMCRKKKILSSFLDNKPERTLENQRAELAALQGMVDCTSVKYSIYNQIIISESDWIIPTANQLDFWDGVQIRRIPGFHFLFYNWQNWDQLLYFCEGAPLA
jgi:biotin synthesis protein BioG